MPAPSSGLDRLQPNFKLKTRLVNKEKLLEKGASQSVIKQVEQGRRLAEIQEATEQAQKRLAKLTAQASLLTEELGDLQFMQIEQDHNQNSTTV